MNAATRDIEIEQGSEFRMTLVWKPGGQIADLAGYSARAQARASYEGPVVLDFDVSVESDGQISLKASASETAAAVFFVDRGVWDLLLTPPGGEPFRLVEGRVNFSSAVTR